MFGGNCDPTNPLYFIDSAEPNRCNLVNLAGNYKDSKLADTFKSY
jgi:hypothetical protein